MSGRVTWRVLVVGLVAVCAAPFVAAGGARDAVDLTRLEPRALLARLHEAAALGNYKGTLVSSSGAAVSSVRITHYSDGRQQYERVDPLDGRERHVYRHNDLVHTVWPAERVVQVEQRDPAVMRPWLLRLQPEGRLFDNYALKAGGRPERIADHETQVFMLEPRGDARDRFPQRLFAESRSGLLLRAEILDFDGRVLQSQGFTEVALNLKPSIDSVLKPMHKLDGYRVVRTQHAVTDLAAEGWTMKSLPSGFAKISCVKRTLPEMPPRDTGSDVSMVQVVYTDGLTHVSLFIEPNRDTGRRPAASSMGATHMLVDTRDQWRVTLIGDVPKATLEAFLQQLERRR